MATAGAQTAPGGHHGSDLQALAAMLTRQKWVIIAVTLAGAVLGLALTAFSAKVYEGTALLSVESSANDATILETGAASRSQALTYTAQVNDRGFLAAAAASLGGGLTATSLDQRVSASVVKDTELIRIAATGASPRDAQDLAQRFADFSVSFFEDQAQRRGAASRRELEAQLEALNTEIDKLGAQRREALGVGDVAAAADLQAQIVPHAESRSEINRQIAENFQNSGNRTAAVSLSTPATAAPDPIKPRPVFNVAVGIVFGALMGLLLAWLRDQLDRTVRSPDEAEHIVGRPALATVPIMRGALVSPTGLFANVFDVLRVNLTLAGQKTPAKAIAVTSGHEGEGKTFTAAGLAEALARGGRRVVVVDADLRRRGLSHRFDLATADGLTEILHDGEPLDSVIVEGPHGVDVLPAGKPHESPPALLDSVAFADLLKDLRRRYDSVIVDTPPVPQIADGLLVAAKCDAVLLVVRLGTVQRRELTSAAEALREPPFTLLGMVVQSPDPNVASGSYYEADESRRSRRRPAAAARKAGR